MADRCEPVPDVPDGGKPGSRPPDPSEILFQMRNVAKGHDPDPGWDWMTQWREKHPGNFGQRMMELEAEYQKTLQAFFQELRTRPDSYDPSKDEGTREARETAIRWLRKKANKDQGGSEAEGGRVA